MEEKDKQYIENNKDNNAKDVATNFNNLAKKYGGPTTVSCFCKTAAYINYINTFLTWYESYE
jgi:hypothetical protein